MPRNVHGFSLEGASLFEVAGSVGMRVFGHERVVFCVTHVRTTFALNTPMSAFTLKFFPILDAVGCGFVLGM